MSTLELNPRTLGFIVGTRAALAFGVGLLVARKLPDSRRLALGRTMVALGAATTIPALLSIRRSARRRRREEG